MNPLIQALERIRDHIGAPGDPEEADFLRFIAAEAIRAHVIMSRERRAVMDQPATTATIEVLVREMARYVDEFLARYRNETTGEDIARLVLRAIKIHQPDAYAALSGQTEAHAAEQSAATATSELAACQKERDRLASEVARLRAALRDIADFDFAGAYNGCGAGQRGGIHRDDCLYKIIDEALAPSPEAVAAGVEAVRRADEHAAKRVEEARREGMNKGLQQAEWDARRWAQDFAAGVGDKRTPENYRQTGRARGMAEFAVFLERKLLDRNRTGGNGNGR